jgi:hypothetical protein
MILYNDYEITLNTHPGGSNEKQCLLRREQREL